jgi:hypothetical protein
LRDISLGLLLPDSRINTSPAGFRFSGVNWAM